MSSNYNDVLARLREQRLSKSLSQNEIAQIVHMTQSNYSKAELALRRLSFNELKCLCDSPIDVYYVFTGRESSSRYRDFFDGCSYWELCSYLNVIYSISSMQDKNEPLEQWKGILEQTSYIPIIMGNQDSKNIFQALRNNMNCQQKKMAEKLGIDIKKFRDLEKGRCLPDSELFWRLYDLFRIPPAVLLEDKNGMASEIATVLDAIDIEYRESMFNILKMIREIKCLR